MFIISETFIFSAHPYQLDIFSSQKFTCIVNTRLVGKLCNLGWSLCPGLIKYVFSQQVTF